MSEKRRIELVHAHDDGYWSGLYGLSNNECIVMFNKYTDDELRESFQRGLVVGCHPNLETLT